MRIFALLVGINEYVPSVGNLQGAVNDAKYYRDFLTDRFGSDKLDVEILLNSDATRENIFHAFRNFLCRAGKDDIALFQFSGHGARWKSAPEFKTWYPDGYDEGLICADSRRTSESWDLADKELAVLLSEVAKKEPHLAVILDCCHSGSGTRSASDLNQLTPRSSRAIKLARPLESYIDRYYSNLKKKSTNLLPPASRHLLMAGCDRYSVAFESKEDHRGIFSKTLLDAIDRTGLDVSYSELFRRVRALVHKSAYGQSPQFQAMLGFNANQSFLSRMAATGTKRHSVHYADWQGWFIDRGAINGLSIEADSPVHVQLYEDETSNDPIGQAVSTDVGLNETKLQVTDFKPDRKKVYSAEITSIAKPPLTVYLHGDSKATKATQKFIEESKFVAANFCWDQESKTGLKYSVHATADGFAVHDLVKDQLIQKIAGTSSAAIEYLVELLNKIASWEHALHLQNPASQVDPDVVEFCYQELGQDGQLKDIHSDHDVEFHIEKRNDAWTDIKGRILGRNKTKQRLHLMLVWFTEQFGVTVLYNGPHDQEQEQFVFALSVNNDIYESMGFCLSEDEGNRASHCLKLFVSKDEIDGFLVGQDPIEIGVTVDDFKPGQTRGAVFAKKLPEVTWFAKSINIHLVRQVAEIGDNESVLAEGKIRIQPHPALRSQASLVPVMESTRGNSADHFVFGMRDHGFELVNFANTRGGSESVLELNSIENRDTLQQQPLEMQVEVPLSDDEYLVPIIFDGEHLLLAGNAWKSDDGVTQISINQLPEQNSLSRGAASTIKLYFFKSICGLENVNTLSRFEFLPDGKVRKSKSAIGKEVDQAKRILILIHGLFGDSRSMAKEFGKIANALRGDKPAFDLVLGYDYECINTTFQETAKQLKTLLKTKGIDENSDKHITIVTHSIGGLVGRWLIEKEGGSEFIDHLVMFGSPNDGSPFGTLGRAVDALGNVVGLAIDWLPSIAKSCIKSIQTSLKERSLTTTVAQMSSQSSFMQELNTADDPGVPYTCIAGDISDYVAKSDDQHVGSLLTKLGGSKHFQSLFGESRHDIAVSMDSAVAILDSRSPKPRKLELPCHHLNYFLSEAGIECLSSIDWFGSESNAESDEAIDNGEAGS